MQQKLRGVLSVNAATFVRFSYGMPAALVYLVAAVIGSRSLPQPSWATLGYAAGGGLFGTSPTDHVSAGSRSVTIPEQVVARDGGISVPFAGRVPVAGRTTVEVQHEIERRLAEKAIEPQVIVTIAKSVTYAATVSGEVVNGARVPLSVNGTVDFKTGSAIQLTGVFIPSITYTVLSSTGVITVDGAGHWVQQERPDQVNEALLRFLRALDPV